MLNTVDGAIVGALWSVQLQEMEKHFLEVFLEWISKKLDVVQGEMGELPEPQHLQEELDTGRVGVPVQHLREGGEPMVPLPKRNQ